MNISFTFFNNYHTAAKEFANGDMSIYGRLMYVLNQYAIDNVIPEDLNPVEKLFLTSIKASIDKSIRLSEAGRKGGSSKNNEEFSSADDVTENTEAVFIGSNNEACKPLEKALNGACNEEEEEIEKELEDEEEIRKRKEKNKKGDFSSSDPSVLFDFSLSNLQNTIFSWFIAKNIAITDKNKDYVLLISEYFENTKYDPEDFLNYVLGIVGSIYHKLNPGIIFSAFSWENTVNGYEATKKAKLKLKNNMPKPPEKCDCGAKLTVGGMPNTVECPKCRKKGKRFWWEYNPAMRTWDKVS